MDLYLIINITLHPILDIDLPLVVDINTNINITK